MKNMHSTHFVTVAALFALAACSLVGCGLSTTTDAAPPDAPPGSTTGSPSSSGNQAGQAGQVGPPGEAGQGKRPAQGWL